jgi:hypothetical protein
VCSGSESQQAYLCALVLGLSRPTCVLWVSAGLPVCSGSQQAYLCALALGGQQALLVLLRQSADLLLQHLLAPRPQLLRLPLLLQLAVLPLGLQRGDLEGRVLPLLQLQGGDVLHTRARTHAHTHAHMHTRTHMLVRTNTC